jgi:hypothetical protein
MGYFILFQKILCQVEYVVDIFQSILIKWWEYEGCIFKFFDDFTIVKRVLNFIFEVKHDDAVNIEFHENLTFKNVYLIFFGEGSIIILFFC